MLLHLSREAGINVQAVHIIPVARTSTYLSILDDKGDMLYAVNDMQIMDMLDVDLLRGQLAMLQQASLLVIDANLPADTLDWLLACCQEVPVFADTVSTAKAPRLRQFVQQIHTLKTGTIEVEALTGLPANSIAQLEEIANKLHKEGLRRVFITRGDKGVFYSDGNTQGSRATHAGQYDIRNAGGAGDAFLAGLVYSWMQDTSLQETLRFATAAAAITVQYAGTNHPELSVSRVNEIMGLEHA
jgi:pseudouridine kinase